jgi:hypothetical protein
MCRLALMIVPPPHDDHGPDTKAALYHPACDCLVDTLPEGWMEFHKSLCRYAMGFMIGMTPFEAFHMSYNTKGYGLCLFGLGIKCYYSICCALSAVLELLLPASDTYIRSQIELVANYTSNGFELLWFLQKFCITMFDLTKDPTWPDWTSDIFKHAKRVLMHCNLWHHCNTDYCDAQQGLLFLCGLQGRYQDMGLLYISMVLLHQQTHCDSAPLPHHLLILPLAQILSDTNQGSVLHNISTTGQRTHCMVEGQTPTSPPTTPHSDNKDSPHIQSFFTHKTVTALPSCPCSPPQVPPNVEFSQRHHQAAPHWAHYQGIHHACSQ